MDFGSGGRDGYCEDEQMMMIKGKFLFSSSSSSSSSPSPLHQYKGLVVPLSEAQIYNNQQRRGCWLGNRFDTTTTQDDITCRSYDNGGGGISSSTRSTPKFELISMDSERNEDNITGSGSGEALRNSGGGGGIEMVEKEHMFDKVVTPSDVGKLNRRVIPKQHAKKCIPLDSLMNEKGLKLNFEDRSGKSWRFWYSYWNSCQSYVMTKGWSRFVKEKKLDARDRGLSILSIIGIGLGSGFLSLVLSFTAVCIWLMVSEQNMMSVEEGKINQLMPDY